MIVIGAGPAGLSAGIYAARAKFHVIIIDKGDIGGQITKTNEVTNYPGIENITGSELTDNMRKQCEYFGASFFNATVQAVDFSSNIKIIKTDKGDFKTLGVIIATGSTPRTIGFLGEQEFKGRGISHSATSDGKFFTGLDVFVVGAGFAAAEEAMYLTQYAKKVTIIAREPAFTCADSIAVKVLTHDKIEVKFHTEVLEVGGDTNLKYAKFLNNKTNETWEYHVGSSNSTFGVFVFAGYVPATDLFKSHITMNEQGYIETDENRQTNVPFVFAAGEVCVKKLRQVVTAVSDGAIAATNLVNQVKKIHQDLGITRVYHEPKQSPKGQENYSSYNYSNGEFITGEMKKQLAPIINKMEHTVKILAILDDNMPISLELKSFLTEVDSLTDKLIIKFMQKGEIPEFEKAYVSFYPCIALFDSNDNYLRVQFHGVPSGHVFIAFIITLYNAARPGQVIEEHLLKKISYINKATNLKVAISLSCTMCPEVVMATQLLALLNPNIEAEMLDLSLFPEIKKRYNIKSVPCMVINDHVVSFW